MQGISKKAKPEEFEAALLAVCGWQPMSATDLATLFQRSRVYLLNNFLTKMVAAGLLEPTLPDQPKHPRQAYRTVAPKEEQP